MYLNGGQGQGAYNALGRTVDGRRQAQAIAGQEEPGILGGRGDIDMRRFLSPALAGLALVQVGDGGAGATVHGALAFTTNERYWLPSADVQAAVAPDLTALPLSTQRILAFNKARNGDPGDLGERVVTLHGGQADGQAFGQRYLEDGDIW